MSSKEKKKKRLDDPCHAAASKILTMIHLMINQRQSFKTGISGVYEECAIFDNIIPTFF